MSNNKTVNKRVNKRLESTTKYIDALQDRYSKLCVIRVDLSYKKPFSDNTLLEGAIKDYDRMMLNRRGKQSVFKYQVGYICLKEYTPAKGIHFHVIVIYDGNKVQKDAYMADKIGKYWEEITNDRGSYHNCNRQKYKYRGIGMLDYSDTKKREILDEYVVSYLYKDDKKQDITPVKNNSKNRAFARGIMPKSKSNAGRPRKS